MRSLDRLTEVDRPQIAAHLLRLDETDRRLRFCSPLKDAGILTHVDRLDLSRGHHLGYFADGMLRGLVEIFAERDTRHCEAALTVDAGHRRRGIGNRLLARTLRVAATAGFERIDLFICERNTAMRELARAHGFEIEAADGELIARRSLNPALPAHHLGELADTTQSLAWQMMTAGLTAWSSLWLGGGEAVSAPTRPPAATPVRPRGGGLQRRRDGALVHLTLDRTEKLNALDLDMVHALHDALEEAETDPRVHAVLIDGAGEAAFSAGGDVRAVRAAQLAGEAYGAHFFHELYALNTRIHTLSKPYVALIDGITMGGGLGVSMHGSHRVATERTAAAMPEARIGFFTDVGASYVLPRLPGEIGTYMALTGARLDAAEAVRVGLASHYIPAARLTALPSLLAGHLGREDAHRTVDRLLDGLTADPGKASILDRKPAIDRCFGFDRVEDIVAALEAEGDDWARHTLATLHQQCPTSLKVTLEAMRRGARQPFRRCMAMEYGLCQTLISRPDFAEGVRAQLVDKCRQPAWQPARLEDVSDHVVARCFARRRAVHPEPRGGRPAGQDAAPTPVPETAETA